jgi:hypothetical protein
MDSQSEFSACALPLYSPSHPSPCYSQDPAYDETRLELSPGIGTRPLPTGTFTKAYGSATIVLLDQEPDSRVPSYGRQASVRGSLLLEQDTNNISEIVAKVRLSVLTRLPNLIPVLQLEGRLEITTVDSGALTVRTFKDSHSIWSPSSPSLPCPARINFACHFPATFQYQGCDYPLPPSYIARFPGFPSLFAKCTYSLTVSMNKGRRLGFLPNTKL